MNDGSRAGSVPENVVVHTTPRISLPGQRLVLAANVRRAEQMLLTAISTYGPRDGNAQQARHEGVGQFVDGAVSGRKHDMQRRSVPPMGVRGAAEAVTTNGAPSPDRVFKRPVVNPHRYRVDYTLPQILQQIGQLEAPFVTSLEGLGVNDPTFLKVAKVCDEITRLEPTTGTMRLVPLLLGAWGKVLNDKDDDPNALREFFETIQETLPYRLDIPSVMQTKEHGSSSTGQPSGRKTDGTLSHVSDPGRQRTAAGVVSGAADANARKLAGVANAAENNDASRPKWADLSGVEIPIPASKVFFVCPRGVTPGTVAGGVISGRGAHALRSRRAPPRNCAAGPGARRGAAPSTHAIPSHPRDAAVPQAAGSDAFANAGPSEVRWQPFHGGVGAWVPSRGPACIMSETVPLQRWQAADGSTAWRLMDLKRYTVPGPVDGTTQGGITTKDGLRYLRTEDGTFMVVPRHDQAGVAGIDKYWITSDTDTTLPRIPVDVAPFGWGTVAPKTIEPATIGFDINASIPGLDGIVRTKGRKFVAVDEGWLEVRLPDMAGETELIRQRFARTLSFAMPAPDRQGIIRLNALKPPAYIEGSAYYRIVSDETSGYRYIVSRDAASFIRVDRDTATGAWRLVNPDDVTGDMPHFLEVSDSDSAFLDESGQESKDEPVSAKSIARHHKFSDYSKFVDRLPYIRNWKPLWEGIEDAFSFMDAHMVATRDKAGGLGRGAEPDPGVVALDIKAVRKSIVDTWKCPRGWDAFSVIRKQRDMALHVYDEIARLSGRKKKAIGLCNEMVDVVRTSLELNGVNSRHMLNVAFANKPGTGRVHVALLYVGSPFLLEWFGPVHADRALAPAELNTRTADQFALFLLKNKEQVFIVDPWSATKVLTFEDARSPMDVSLRLAGLTRDAGFTETQLSRYEVSAVVPVLRKL